MATELIELEGHIIDSLILAKVMDTITSSGVSQSNELDYTLHSLVTLHDVVIP